MRHLDVRIDAVADHRNLPGLQRMPLQNPRQHVRIGFSQRDVGAAARGVLDGRADRPAVDQNRRTVRRAYPVGIRRQIGESLLHPPGRPAQPCVFERHVEGDHHRIRNILRRIRRRRIARSLELRNHRRRSEQEEASGRRKVRLQVVDRRQRRGVHLLARGPDPHAGKAAKVVGNRFRGVVRQKRMADSGRPEPRQKARRPGKQHRTHVDRAVHVEGDVADLRQAPQQLCVLPDGAIAVKTRHLRMDEGCDGVIGGSGPGFGTGRGNRSR